MTDTRLEHAMKECGTCIFGAVDGLLKKTGLQVSITAILFLRPTVICCSIKASILSFSNFLLYPYTTASYFSAFTSFLLHA